MKTLLLFLATCFLNHFTAAQNDIIYVSGSTKKIEQLVGDFDKHLNKPTMNLTNARFGVHATDLGVPFEHKGKTYVLFGDIPPPTYDRDPLAFTEDTNPDDGLSLDFVTDPDGRHRPIDIPGVSLMGFEVPMEGVSWNDIMYIYATTDRMGRSVVAKSTDDGYTFAKLYDLSTTKFVNVSVVKTKSTTEYPEPADTDIQVMLGSGEYRKSDVFLAYQRADLMEEKSLQYFTGLVDGSPAWTQDEEEAIPLFNQPCVGELSVSYNEFIKKWILLYNCGAPRGINCRTADHPWGPWSDPFVIFNPAANVDKGYCYFIHSNWAVNNCDNVHDPGRANEWGGEYGPYQFEKMAKGDENSTTIYYTLSTWNPYTVVLMKSTIRDKESITVSTLDSVERLSDADFQIYPNPASEKFKVEFKRRRKGVSEIELRDLQGKIIIKEQISVVERDGYEVVTRDLPSGIYFIKVTQPGTFKVIAKKIMVEH